LADAIQSVLSVHADLDNTPVIQGAEEILRQLETNRGLGHYLPNQHPKIRMYAALYGSLLRSGNKVYTRTVKQMCDLALGSTTKNDISSFLGELRFIEKQIESKFRTPMIASDILPHFAHILNLSPEASKLSKRMAEISIPDGKSFDFDTKACAISLVASKYFKPEIDLATASTLCKIGKATLRLAVADLEERRPAFLHLIPEITASVTEGPMSDIAVSEASESAAASDADGAPGTNSSDAAYLGELYSADRQAAACSATEEVDAPLIENAEQEPIPEKSLSTMGENADHELSVPEDLLPTKQEQPMHITGAGPAHVALAAASAEEYASFWSQRQAADAACDTSDGLWHGAPPPFKYRRVTGVPAAAAVVAVNETEPGEARVVVAPNGTMLVDDGSAVASSVVGLSGAVEVSSAMLDAESGPPVNATAAGSAPMAPTAAVMSTEESVQLCNAGADGNGGQQADVGGDAGRGGERAGGTTIVFACVDGLPPVVVVVDSAGEERIELD